MRGSPAADGSETHGKAVSTSPNASSDWHPGVVARPVLTVAHIPVTQISVRPRVVALAPRVRDDQDMSDPAAGDLPGHHEPHQAGLGGRLNWLRAGVLGANDGVVSTAAIVLGVAGATDSRGSIVLAGLIGMMAGAMSMAAGEYVSVSTQRDTEKAVLDRDGASCPRPPMRS